MQELEQRVGQYVGHLRRQRLRHQADHRQEAMRSLPQQRQRVLGQHQHVVPLHRHLTKVQCEARTPGHAHQNRQIRVPERQRNALPLGQRTDLQAHRFVLIQKLGYAVQGRIRLHSGAQHTCANEAVAKSTETIKVPPCALRPARPSLCALSLP